jgi:hypothetical protein
MAPSGMCPWRSHDGVELAFKTWRHFEGAAVVCVNGYRVK